MVTGEHCNVVFEYIVTESTSRRERGFQQPPHASLPGSVTINAKTTVHCFQGSSPRLGLLKSRQGAKLEKIVQRYILDFGKALFSQLHIEQGTSILTSGCPRPLTVKDTFFRFLPFQVHLPSKFAKTANMSKTNFHLELIQSGYKKRRFDG